MYNSSSVVKFVPLREDSRWHRKKSLQPNLHVKMWAMVNGNRVDYLVQPSLGLVHGKKHESL